jgi:hypothetical protein
VGRLIPATGVPVVEIAGRPLNRYNFSNVSTHIFVSGRLFVPTLAATKEIKASGTPAGLFAVTIGDVT